MAKVRIGFSTELNIGSELSGIGTDNPTNTKQVLGNIHATNAKAVGITTLTTPFEGFTDTKLSLQGSAGAKQHTTSGEIIIEGDVTVSSGTTFTSGPENLTVTDNFTLPGISDDRPSVGTTRFNENLAALEFYTGSEWKAVNSRVDMGSGGRAIWAGGYRSGASTKSIDSIQIPTQGNSVSFGDLSAAGQDAHGLSSSTRGLFGGKFNSDAIEYVTMASSGNSIDFGNMATSVNYPGACSSSTRGMWSGGMDPSAINTIQYVEINTLGNAADFGDLTGTRLPDGGAFSSPTRGFAGGGHPATLASCDMWTIASKGNAIDFGDFKSTTKYFGAGFSNNVRGVVAGGTQAPVNYSEIIQTIIMSSAGNATDFGNMVVGGQGGGGSATATRGVYARGREYPNGSDSPALEYIDMQSGGNAVFFGDLRGSESTNSYSRHVGPCGDSHGGLGGF